MLSRRFSLALVLTLLGACASVSSPRRSLVLLASDAAHVAALAELGAARTARDRARVQQACKNLQVVARNAQAPLVALALSAGAQVSRQFWLVNGFVLTGAVPSVLQADPRVREIATLADLSLPREGNVVSTGGVTASHPTDANNHRSVHVHAQGQRGAGVGLAVVDHGVDSDVGIGRPHRLYFPNGDINKPHRLTTLSQAPDVDSQHGVSVHSLAAGGKWSDTSPFAFGGHAPEAAIFAVDVIPPGSNSYTQGDVIGAFQAVACADMDPHVCVVASALRFNSSPSSPFALVVDNLALAGFFVGQSSGMYPTGFPSVTNALVGSAVHMDSKAPISSELTPDALSGLQYFDTRVFPDLVTSGGTSVPVAKVGDEEDPFEHTGTTLAAANLAGAATLYVAERLAAAGDPVVHPNEIRAAILATLEKLPWQSGDFVPKAGGGFLRIDRLHEVAKGNGYLAQSSVSANKTVASFQVPVQAGGSYSAAISWMRADTAHDEWSNLRLRVLGTATGDKVSDTPLNCNEMLRFEAAEAGTLTVEVDLVSLEAGLVVQDFALVVAGPF